MKLDRLHFLLMGILGIGGIISIYMTSPSTVTAEWGEVNGMILTFESKEEMGTYMHGVQKKKLEVKGKYEYVLNGKGLNQRISLEMIIIMF